MWGAFLERALVARKQRLLRLAGGGLGLGAPAQGETNHRRLRAKPASKALTNAFMPRRRAAPAAQPPPSPPVALLTKACCPVWDKQGNTLPPFPCAPLTPPCCRAASRQCCRLIQQLQHLAHPRNAPCRHSAHSMTCRAPHGKECNRRYIPGASARFPKRLGFWPPVHPHPTPPQPHHKIGQVITHPRSAPACWAWTAGPRRPRRSASPPRPGSACRAPARLGRRCCQSRLRAAAQAAGVGVDGCGCLVHGKSGQGRGQALYLSHSFTQCRRTPLTL